jgi:predicted dehydrogenase
VRWGILGVANIALKRVIAGFKGASNCSLQAIASRDLDRARDVAARFGIPLAFGTYEALLSFDGIDAVYIPLPHHLHREWVLAAARAGKHVLCEKPLALTASDASEMVAGCEAAGVLLMEAFMYRFHPSWVEISQLVRDGAIGRVRTVHSHFAYFLDDPNSFRSRLDLGGGALMDIGCYGVSVSRLLFSSEPKRVLATAVSHPDNGTDIVTSALLDFADGHATFHVATQLQRAQGVDIGGTVGRIEVETPFNIPSDEATRARLIRGGSPSRPSTIETLTFGPADQYSLEIEAFNRSISEGAPLSIAPSDSIANIRVLERVQEAMAMSAGGTSRGPSHAVSNDQESTPGS